MIAGVRLARDRGWKVAARAGGHAWAGWSVRDDALLIDLAGLRDMTIDVDNLTATVRPAFRGGQDLGPALQQHGLVFPGGHCSTVGLGGYLLQGGQGWNSRQWGWALRERARRRCRHRRRRADPCRRRAEQRSLLGRPRRRARRSSAWSRASTCGCTACPRRSRTPRTRFRSSASTS